MKMPKMPQRELLALVAAPVVAIAAPQLGIPEAIMSEFVVGLFGAVSAYAISRGYAKGQAGVDR